MISLLSDYRRFFPVVRIVLLAAFTLSGCDQSSSGNNSNRPPSVTPPTPPPPPPTFEKPVYTLQHAIVPPFLVGIASNRLSGVPGTHFDLTADTSATQASFAWQTDAGPVGDGQEVTVSFDSPGLKTVTLTVDDEAGQTYTSSIALMVFDPAAALPPVTRAVMPETGPPGSVVKIVSPALQDPAANVQFVLGDAGPIPGFRPVLGEATVHIPLDLPASVAIPDTLKIQLEVDGQVLDTLEFQITNPPGISGQPGALVASALQVARDKAQEMADNLQAAIEVADPEEAEIAVMRGLAETAVANLAAIDEQVTPLLAQLDAATLSRLDQLLAANGITEVYLSNLSVVQAASASARLPGDDVIDSSCLLHETAAIVDAITGTMETAAPFIAIGALAAGGPLGTTAAGVANAFVSAGIASDIAKLLQKVVPRVDDRLLLTATPGSLREDQQSTIELRARLTQDYDPCADVLDKLLGELAKIATQKILRTIPTNGLLTDAIARARYYDGFQDEVMRGFSEYIENVIAALSKSVVEISGINNTFKQFAGKFCALENRLMPPIMASADVLKLRPASSGVLSDFNENTALFRCNGSDPSPAVEAFRQCGASRTLAGDVEVRCEVEGCTEDASAAISVNIVPTASFNVSSSCPSLKEQMERNDATISVTNNSNRTVKLGVVSYRESSIRNLSRGPCEGDNLLPGETLTECLNRVVAGCDHALSGQTVGFSGFLLPGETSRAVSYICSQEFVDIPPGSSGNCGDAQLETVTTNWIVQAVYCDNAAAAVDGFCSQMNLTMKTFGQPSQNWGHIERKACP